MAHQTSTIELRKMPTAELRKEVEEKRLELIKMHLGLEMQSFKDSAKYRREKRLYARMLTVLNEQKKSEPEALKKAPKAAKVPASKKRSGSPATTSKS